MRLPRPSGSEVIRALKQLGFREILVRGSHHYLVFPSDPGRRATVPVHGNRTLNPRIVQSILRTARVSREELADHL